MSRTGRPPGRDTTPDQASASRFTPSDGGYELLLLGSPTVAAAGIRKSKVGVTRMPSATSGMKAVRSVVVVRALDGIGDMLCAVPALRSLRAGLPDARVTLVGLASARGFVARFPAYVDELVEFPGFPGIPEVPPSVTALPGFLADVQARGFDLALQMQGSGFASNPFTMLLAARDTAGFYLPGQYRPEGGFIPYPADVHEIGRLTALVSSLGMPDTGTALEWPVTDRDREELRSATRGRLTDAYAIVHAGASEQSKRWPPERFGRVADRLAAKGLQVALTGTAGDSELTAAVARRTSAEVLDLAGATTVGALGALVEGARLVVCNDTGVSHVAAALRVPSVVVFSASDPRRWAPLDAELHVAVHQPSPVDEVLRAVERQLGREGARVA